MPSGIKFKELIMISKEIVVRCESGLHNKQATYFVQKANEFDCSIYLESENRKMNAKSLLGIMSLGIITGATVTLSADGRDAEDAIKSLEALLLRDVY
jgi:phosphocarrier protein